MSPRKRYNITKLAEAIADILLIISQSVTMHALFDGNILLGTISLVCGTLGRIIARFFQDEDNDGIPDIIDNDINRDDYMESEDNKYFNEGEGPSYGEDHCSGKKY